MIQEPINRRWQFSLSFLLAAVGWVAVVASAWKYFGLTAVVAGVMAPLGYAAAWVADKISAGIDRR